MTTIHSEGSALEEYVSEDMRIFASCSQPNDKRLIAKERNEYGANAMKICLATFLVLMFSVPTTMAGSLTGKHIWCPGELDPMHSIGLSFTDSGAEYWYLNGYNVAQSLWAVREEADSIYLSKQGSDEDYVVDRSTLRDVSGRQCSFVNSSGDIMSKMLAIAREALANN